MPFLLEKNKCLFCAVPMFHICCFANQVERVRDNIQHDCVDSSNQDADENHEESNTNAQSPRASVQLVHCLSHTAFH